MKDPADPRQDLESKSLSQLSDYLAYGGSSDRLSPEKAAQAEFLRRQTLAQQQAAAATMRAARAAAVAAAAGAVAALVSVATLFMHGTQ
jgi:hypothetical protein